MTKHLRVRYSHPLEREYEGWIVAGIERYLTTIGLPYAIWAINPDQEKVWPADEKLLVSAKVVGLQFKQAKIASGPLGADRLHWSLHQPASQFGLIKDNHEIFYCLPTFIDREFRDEAVHHCLFWRPDGSLPDNKNAWYDNPAADTPYKKISTSMRWGLFFEQLLECTVGIKTASTGEIQDIAHRICSYVQRDALLADRRIDSSGPDGGLYMLAIALES